MIKNKASHRMRVGIGDSYKVNYLDCRNKMSTNQSAREVFGVIFEFRVLN